MVPLSPGAPYPVATKVAQYPVGGAIVTSIARTWMADDTRRCRLCDRCAANHAGRLCLIVTTREVDPKDAPLFSTRGQPTIGPDGRRITPLKIVGDGEV